jgi:hypothetical protein
MNLKDKGGIFSTLTIVAALGYFVDIYDLVLFSVERVDSLRDLLGQNISDNVLEKEGNVIKVHQCTLTAIKVYKSA